MKFDKLYIKQVIFEEVTNYLSMKKKLKRNDDGTKLEALRKDLIDLFIKYRQDITKTDILKKEDHKKALEKSLDQVKKQYGLKHLSYQKFIIFCLHILNNRVDPQLLTFIKTSFQGDSRFYNYQDKLDNYGMSITPEEEKNSNQIRDPDPGFMRVPKSDNALSDQEDLRKNRKY